MNDIDRLAHWIWSVGSEKENLYKNKATEEPPKGIAGYDKWVNDNILSVADGRMGVDVDIEIDKRLNLLREWILLLRHRGRNGQVVIREVIKGRNVCHDIRNFEAFVRYKEKNYGNSILRRILS
jgi:hypothetical protein